MPSQSTGTTRTVSARIALASYEILVARAKREKKKVSPLASELLLKGLLPDEMTATRLAQLEDRLVELQDQVITLTRMVREDVAASAAVLLVNAGKCTRAEAKAWVEKRLLASQPNSNED